MRRHVPKDVLVATDLHVAYTFPGSFGVMLTIPRDVFLFPEWETRADETIDIVFGVAKSRSPKEVAQVAEHVGRAPIAALYDWAKANAVSKTGAELEWNRNSPKKRDVLLQYPEFADLSASIEETSEERTEISEYTGILVGADTKTRRFHFVTSEDDRDIRGRFTDAISDTQKAQLPGRYVAKVRANTTINFAKAEEEVSYDLLALIPLE